MKEIERSGVEYLFDGFAHRKFDDAIDGWRLTQIYKGEFPSVELAKDILDMADEINRLRREVWVLQKEKSA